MRLWDWLFGRTFATGGLVPMNEDYRDARIVELLEANSRYVIQYQEARNELRQALRVIKPFADEAAYYCPREEDPECHDEAQEIGTGGLTAGDCIRADRYYDYLTAKLGLTEAA